MVVLVLINGCSRTPLTSPAIDSFTIKITDMFWDSNMKIIGITLDPCPSTWSNWTMYIDGEEVSMEAGLETQPFVQMRLWTNHQPALLLGLFLGLAL